jgi:tape measure domain-containing protein
MAESIVKLRVDPGDAVRKIREVGDAAGRLAKRAGGAASKLGGIQGVLGRLALVETGRRMIQAAATFKQTELRLKLLSQEHGEYAKATALATKAAKKFGLGQTEALAGVTDIYARLRPLKISLKDIESTYIGFNTVAKLSGVNAQSASAAFTQLAQALGSGRLQGDEFRSIAEQVPGLLVAVSKETGISTAQLKKFASEGKLSSEILIKSLKKVEKEGAGKIAEIMKNDPTQKMKNLQNATEALSIAIGTVLLPAVTPIIEAITAMVNVFNGAPGPVKTLTAAAIGLGAAFVVLAPGIMATVRAIRIMRVLLLRKFIPALVATQVAMGPIAIGMVAISAAVAGLGWAFDNAGKKHREFTELLTSGTAEQQTDALIQKQKELEELLANPVKTTGRAGQGKRNRYREDVKLLKEQIKQLQTVIDNTNALAIEEAMGKANEAMKALGAQTRQTSEQFKTAFGEKLVSYMKTVNDFGGQVAGVITKTFQGAEDAIVKFVQTGKMNFSDFANSIIAEMIRIAVRQAIIAPIMNMFGGWMSKLFPGKKAAGGPVSGGKPYIVGERGPELFTPNSNGSITPNHAVGGTTNVSVSVDATNTEVQGDEDTSRELGKLIGAAVQAEIVNQQRPGGLLSPA